MKQPKLFATKTVLIFMFNWKSEYLIKSRKKVGGQSLLAGKSNGRGRLSTHDLLVLASLDKFIFILKIFFNFLQKQATLMRRSTVLSLSPTISIPCF